MSRFLRRALPTALATGALVLAFSSALAGGADRMVPSVLLLALTGAAAVLYRYATRQRRAAPLLRAPAAPLRTVSTVPTQRSAPRCVIPAQRPAADPGVAPHPAAAARWSAARTGAGRTGVRHCVVPRGEVPHQRRASDGS